MSQRKPIDVDELRKVFRIRNGNLEKIDARSKYEKWKIVTNKNNNGNGYCQVEFNKRKILYHIIVWILTTGNDVPNGLRIDHKNGNRLCSTMSNMRLVTNRQNNQNTKKHRGGKLVGCYLNSGNNKYLTQIQIHENIIHIGYYETEQEGHEAYTIACKHISDYKDNKSFREIIKREMETK